MPRSAPPPVLVWPDYRRPHDPAPSPMPAPPMRTAAPVDDHRGDWGCLAEPDPVLALLLSPYAEHQAAFVAAARRDQLDWTEVVLLLQELPPPPPGSWRLVPIMSGFADLLEHLRDDICSGRFPMPCTPIDLVMWCRIQPALPKPLPDAFLDEVARSGGQLAALVVKGQSASSPRTSGGSSLSAPRRGRPTTKARDRQLWDTACQIRSSTGTHEHARNSVGDAHCV